MTEQQEEKIDLAGRVADVERRDRAGKSAVIGVVMAVLGVRPETLPPAVLVQRMVLEAEIQKQMQ